MKLAKFEFDLPKQLIAKYPKDYRDESRLMVLDRKNGTIDNKIFKDLIDYFDAGDVITLNNTKVFSAIIYGNKERTGSKIKIFLLRELSKENKLWDVLVDPARKIRIGNKLFFGEDDSLVAEVIDNTTSRGRTLRFLFDGSYDEFKEKLLLFGKTPLPSIIKREAEPEDKIRYQTIFAKHEGSVVAPAASLHFSKHLMKRLELKDVLLTEATLHTNFTTLIPVEIEDLSKYKISSEQIVVPKETADIINKAKENKRKVCAVGSSIMRALESCVSSNNTLNPYKGWTNKFIFPSYDFKIANTMITNFHTPKSTSMMTASAFAGFDFLREAYKYAIKQEYRFGVYGDAMLIL